ncbi:hypothetical protein A5792_23385 [Mycolicibacterium peregrinum]|uniref:Intersectin-EH binding protein Ibp1 n=1 Tax=Mycolicibacterium peregrinum TaxID=43304 RepID=A0A1A0QZZ9_MYCPR|nr:hypothetical protein [Mycolicibacterium peregrinum]OBB27785.1 hypothetical protein A5792_23385 [Mycolicibacterium peregrinum]
MGRIVLAVVALVVVLAPPAAAEPAAFDPTGNRSGGPVPTVNGVPCVGGNLGVCLSFRQNRPPAANPGARSSVGHSPTVRR